MNVSPSKTGHIGLLCFFLGVLIVVVDFFNPGVVSIFFDIDIVNEFEDVVEAQVMPCVVVEGGADGDGRMSGDSSCEDERLSDGAETTKRVQFVATSRYAGISNRNPKKFPLAQTTSIPITSKETLAVCDDVRPKRSSLASARRCMSVGDEDDGDMGGTWFNEAPSTRFDEHGENERTERERNSIESAEETVELSSISEESSASPHEAVERTPNGSQRGHVEADPGRKSPDQGQYNVLTDADRDSEADIFEGDPKAAVANHELDTKQEGGAKGREYIALDIIAPDEVGDDLTTRRQDDDDDDDDSLPRDDVETRRGYDNLGYETYNESSSLPAETATVAEWTEC